MFYFIMYNLYKNLLFSLIIILIIIYIIFAIIGLIDTSFKKEHQICSHSNLWIYCLISIILFGFTLETLYKNYIGIETFYKITFNFFLCLGLYIFGLYELFEIECTINLNNTILYGIAFTHWIFNSIGLSLFSTIIVLRLKEILITEEQKFQLIKHNVV